MSSNVAVLVQNAHKSYGKKEVLQGLSMQVPKGCIYGLLGSSGCGKTTLLTCLVGRRKLDSGEVWVLGGKPGTPGSGVPGAKVGYMPQDIALVGEFTVKDAIYYFGRVFNMDEDQIEERFYELSNLLDLPPEDRFIKNCSGGQQRRVSFAASMVQMPELLILDEPTVGVDPILRERIWDYLVEITSKSNMAVIITTHYIEETRQANKIGLMRNGCLLAEEAPLKLLQMFQTDILEEVFFILSQRQNEGRLTEALSRNNYPAVQNSNTDISLQSFDTTRGSTDILTSNTQKPAKKAPVGGEGVNLKRMRALLGKNWKQLYRNISGLAFIFIFPILQNSAFLMAVGHDPRNVPLGIVNQESLTTLCENFSFANTTSPYGYNSCHLRNLSCRFLKYIEDPMIDKVYYEHLDDAMKDIKHGKIVGVLQMAENMTESFEARMEDGRDVDLAALSASEIKVWLDMSNRQIGQTMKYRLLSRFKDYQKDLLRDCNTTPKLTEYFEEHMFYGDENASFTEYMTPGLLMTLNFFLMTIMTSQIIVTDRREGLWDRSVIAGVSSLEICLTHFILQTGIIVIYTIQFMVITFAIFEINSVGSLWIVALLTFCQGLSGMGYGFLISILSTNISMSNILATGSFYIMIFISGLVWPIEGMPISLQWISKSLPFTLAAESVRNVMKKGWNLSYVDVWGGLVIEIVWFLIFVVVNTVLVQKSR